MDPRNHIRGIYNFGRYYQFGSSNDGQGELHAICGQRTDYYCHWVIVGEDLFRNNLGCALMPQKVLISPAEQWYMGWT